MTHGPNVTKLIKLCIAREAIPPGGGLADGLRFWGDAEYRKQVLAKAEITAMTAIAAIKHAPDNPFGEDEEKIAGYLLEAFAKRKAGITPGSAAYPGP